MDDETAFVQHWCFEGLALHYDRPASWYCTVLYGTVLSRHQTPSHSSCFSGVHVLSPCVWPLQLVEVRAGKIASSVGSRVGG